MIVARVKSLLVAAFSLFCLSIAAQQPGGQNGHIDPEEGKGEKKETTKKFDANEVIFGHVLDAHQFHFLTYKDKNGEAHHVGINLPVLLYSPQRGFEAFSSGNFHHGETSYKDYLLVTPEYKEYLVKNNVYTEETVKALQNETIIAIDANGLPSSTVKVYDFSLTRNVVQMMLALIVLVWILLGVAARYRRGEGVTSAPSGLQNAIEPIITFVRDDVARPNLGPKYKKYMPYLLTIFFFILINNIFGLIPGSANVTGNIAFTLVLGLVSFFVIMFSSNKHYWGHIFNPPVPGGVKPIMIPVEFLGIFTKPVALIVRLFANMIAGHIIIICLISLIFIFGNLSSGVGWGFSPISIAFTVFIYFIEILVAFLQAYIFTNLTAVFIGQAFEGSHDDVNHHEDAVIV
jgi:F-type H+-transporting ATPase subunit a